MNTRVSKAVADPVKHWTMYICMVFATMDTSWKYSVLPSKISHTLMTHNNQLFETQLE